MLIDFTVENFRSIKEPVTLSAIAKPSRARAGSARTWVKSDHEIAAPYPVEGRGFDLLPVLGLFGANASGKTNILESLDLLLNVMTQCYQDKSALTPFVPFRLEPDTANDITRFQLRVVLAGTIYSYALHISQTRIVFEQLRQRSPTSKRDSLVFERQWDENLQAVQWKKRPSFHRPSLHEYDKIPSYQSVMSYLVTAGQPEEIQPFWQWLLYRWPGTSFRGREIDKALVKRVSGFSGVLRRGVNLLRLLDTGVTNVEIATPNNDLWVTHRTRTGDVRWPLSEESSGTQSLIALLWRILQALDHATPVLADEFGAEFHPNITREIVRLFQSAATNPRRAQLIFISHDSALMERNLLRRDQIWLTQKREDNSTELYPLTDFKPRNDLALSKAYLDGRLEAVPFLPDMEDLLPELEAVA